MLKYNLLSFTVTISFIIRDLHDYSIKNRKMQLTISVMAKFEEFTLGMHRFENKSDMFSTCPKLQNSANQ